MAGSGDSDTTWLAKPSSTPALVNSVTQYQAPLEGEARVPDTLSISSSLKVTQKAGSLP